MFFSNWLHSLASPLSGSRRRMLRRNKVRQFAATESQALEERVVMTVNAVVDAATKTLLITGTEGNDAVNVYDYSESSTLQSNGKWSAATKSNADYIYVRDEASTRSFHKSLFNKVSFVGLGGDDTFEAVGEANTATNRFKFSTNWTIQVDAGAGNDRITTGRQADTIVGGAGDDTLNGHDHHDLLLGGDGNDVLIGGVNNDTLNGGAGNDNLSDDHGYDVAYGGDGDDTISTGNHNDIVYGGAGNDILNAGLESDSVFGEGGNDLITDDHGHDTLNGGDDNDTITGGMHNDVITCGAGNDVVLGGIGDDRIDGGDGEDSLDGGDHEDAIYGGNGNDTLVGGLRNDRLYGDAGDDLINDDNGHDYIEAGDGNDTVNSGEHEDVIHGGNGNDLINSGSWNDLTYAGAGLDTVDGGSGDDRLFGGADNDVLEGGIGNDWVLGEGGSDTLSGGDGNDQIRGGADRVDRPDRPVVGEQADSADEISGGAGNDTLHGGLGNDTVRGGLGNDYIIGQFGDDSLLGEAGDDYVGGNWGADTVSGGEGNDRVDGGMNDGSDWVNITMVAMPALYDLADLVQGDSGNDTLTGDLGNDTIFGGTGNDRAFGNSDNDLINTGDGNDYIEADYGNDTVDSESGNDTVYGQQGDDLIDAGSGNDYAHGFDGNDTINGGDGNDQLIGANGNDRLIAGAGNDTASGSDGLDTIYGGEGNDSLVGEGHSDSIFGELGKDTLNGGDGNDAIEGGADNDLLTGGNQNDTLRGGFGDDMLNGGDGNDFLYGAGDASTATVRDLLTGGSGDDALLGGKEVDLTTKDVGGGSVMIGTLLNPNDLRVAGLGSDRIYVFHSSQAWTKGTTAFTTSGRVTLQGEDGEVAVKTGMTVKIKEERSFGSVVQVEDAFQFPSLNFLKSVDVGLPNLTFGLMTGAAIRNRVDPDAPLFDDGIYFVGAVGVNLAVSSGTVSVGIPEYSLTFVMDPVRCMAYSKVVFNGVVSASGFALHDDLAFRPDAMPNNYTDLIGGNLYTRMDGIRIVSFGDRLLDLEAGGASVIDFPDFDLTKDSAYIDAAFKGTTTFDQLEQRSTGSNGVRVGIMGNVDVSAAFVTVRVADGSVIFDFEKHDLYFRGQDHQNPIEAIPILKDAGLDKVLKLNSGGNAVDGFIDFDHILNSEITVENLLATFTVDFDEGVELSAEIETPVLDVDVEGSIQWDGDVYLAGHAKAGTEIDVKIAEVGITLNYDVLISGNFVEGDLQVDASMAFQIYGIVEIDLLFDSLEFGAKGWAKAELHLALEDFTSLRATIGIEAGVRIYYGAGSFGIGGGGKLTIDNRGILVDLDDLPSFRIG